MAFSSGRWWVVAAGAAVLALGLSGCSPEAPEPPDASQVRLHPTQSPDRWLSDAYEQGFGEIWTVPGAGDTICGIADDVVLLDIDRDDASSVAGVRLSDGSQAWQIPDTHCQPRNVFNGSAHLVINVDEPDARYERVDIATGERTALGPGQRNVTSLWPIAEREGTSYVLADQRPKAKTLVALTDAAQPLWTGPTDDFWRCEPLDGGVDADSDTLPDGARIGCSAGETFYLFDPVTGETVVEVDLGHSDKSGVHVLPARDGYIELPKDPPDGIESLEQFDLDGSPAGTNTVATLLEVPREQPLLTLADMQVVTDLHVRSVAADGRVVTMGEAIDETVFAATGTPLDRTAAVRFTTASGGAVLASIDDSTSVVLLDTLGEELGRQTADWYPLQVMDGYLVSPGDGGEAVAMIYLPASE